MEYTIIFDVSQSGYRNWWFPAFGIIFVAFGCLLLCFRHPSRTPIFPYLLLGFAVFWTFGALIITTQDYFGLAAALRHGRCEVVEGVITQFTPMPTTGKGKESFVVSGKRFEYSDFTVSPGFNHSTYRGGPMREGLAVRIHYHGDDIARLEIAK